MLDHYSVHVHNNQQVAALPQLDRGSDYESERHRFESYTPHQLKLKPPATGAFLLWRHRMDSNLGRGASVKKTRSVFSERARAPAGGRSRRGSAERMRGILYAAPIEIEASGNGGFSFMATPHGFEPRPKRPFLIDSCKISSMRLGEAAACSFFRRPIRVIFRGRASDI